ncbi:hypothetical protein N1F89_17295, partial [Aquibium sp. A9E412]|uniref:hypothetical protein n=1 Tax=Aquibium sp. A9E412 TaxID=2976767 RepID=UPI0025B0ECD8
AGRSETALAQRARREGWAATAPGPGDAAPLERRLAVLSERLVGELEETSAAGAAAGDYDKARIDALTAMLRMVEKIGDITRVPERAKENQTATDADMAAALERVDARILHLARALARRLGADGAGRPAGADDRR